MVSVIIPTLNEELRIYEIVRFCLSSPLVQEVIVLDDGSNDQTTERAKAAGAKVHFSSMLGKGASLQDGIQLAQEQLVLFLDGDIYNFSPQLIERMVDPLLKNEADFIKGNFQRKAGRVTALTAIPLLKTFFPELATFRQPLGGIMAAKKETLENLTFETDYGVDVALLIDVAQSGARILEVPIGSLDHDHQSLEQLGKMSLQIVRTILKRATQYNRFDSSQLKEAEERERTYQLQMDQILDRLKAKEKIALFDMDGVLIEKRFIVSLAEEIHKKKELEELLDQHQLDASYRTQQIAKLLEGTPKEIFEKVAAELPLMADVQQVVVELKKRGYSVGILTDSYFIVAEIIRKRIFADFSIAHLLQFKDDRFTGQVELSPFMQAHDLNLQEACDRHDLCKANFLSHLEGILPLETPLLHFVGDGLNDICLLRKTPKSLAFRPQHELVNQAASQKISHLKEILSIWD